ncbi:MAG: TonB-dependent receptor [Bacteroidales bacterium]|nr:TonB-dependent receptor [Bacteroidales bacterium]
MRALPLGALLSFAAAPAAAQGIDTVQRLEEITVSSQRTPSTTRTAAPTQVMEAGHLEKIGALQLSDAVRQMAGVTLKDYGGVGGIKTVSARGLGSQFSAVTLDGVPIDNSQNGQVDLGRYMLGNAAYVSFSQGQEQRPLLTARAYAAGNVLNMETAEPQFFPGERTRMKAGIEGGSFGMLSPTLLWEQKWNKQLKTSLYGNYLQSRGDYPFTLYYTASHQDSSSTERRKHSAVWMATVDGNLFYTVAEGNTLTAKVHYNKGKRELPGPVAFYSQTVSGQSSTEELAFAQARWRVERRRWSAQLLGKVSHSFDDYTDTSLGSHIYNSYRQREGYLSGSYHRRLASWLDLDLAADGSLARLQSNLSKRNDVSRRNVAAAAALHSRHLLGDTRLDLRAHLLLTHVQDRVADLDTMPTYRRLSPYLSAMLAIGQGTTLRAFYKQSFRAPNFSELYFFYLMPRNLMPEQAHQFNLGISQAASLPLRDAPLQATASLDAYYNHVRDKIVSRPTSNMFYWSMQNLGTVDILGLDATARLEYNALSLHLNYTFQQALDHSDPESKTYDNQIIYTPRHSGGATARWENRWVNLGLTAMVVGHRHSGPQNTDENRLPAYTDLGLSLDRSLDLPLGTLTLRAQVLNLLDTQYEIVASYPMMGRNWRLAATYEF